MIGQLSWKPCEPEPMILDPDDRELFWNALCKLRDVDPSSGGLTLSRDHVPGLKALEFVGLDGVQEVLLAIAKYPVIEIWRDGRH